MSLADETYAYRGRLPHLNRRDCVYYVTFCTKDRWVMPPGARTLTLASCVYEHGERCWLDSLVVMADHVHLILKPYEDASLTAILERIKGAAAHRINRLLGRSGSVWQRESFDRLIRSAENLAKKRQYILDNPVRKGIVARCQDYPWLWTPYHS